MDAFVHGSGSGCFDRSGSGLGKKILIRIRTKGPGSETLHDCTMYILHCTLYSVYSACLVLVPCVVLDNMPKSENILRQMTLVNCQAISVSVCTVHIPTDCPKKKQVGWSHFALFGDFRNS